MTDFTMPSLGADMNEGTVLEWKVGVGDAVRKGDVILEVDTDKAAFEVEADRPGTLREILVQPGTTVPVGTVLARLTAPGESAEAAAGAAGKGESAAPAGPAAGEGRRRRKSSPAARKRARELGVNIDVVPGTGMEGAVRLQDVEAAAQAAAETRPAAEAPAPTEPAAAAPGAEEAAQPSRQARLRGVIAAVMSRSKREIPHYYLEHGIDLEPALAWLEAQNAERPINRRILPNALLLKAVAQALWDVPELNGYWIDGALQQQESVNLGVAVSLRGGGVIAPAIHDAADKSLDELMADLVDLVRRARAGTLRHSEMTEGTITVTSLGDRGTDVVYGVIFPPQVALVGFGTIAQRPWVVEGQVVARRVVTATLAADHRASDGHRGGLFLRAVDHRLQEPEAL